MKSAKKIKEKCWRERSAAVGRREEGGNEEATVVVNFKDQ